MKERLVGAAILVGLVVILVPEMLSGPQDTEVGAADADGPLQTYTIDLTNPGAPLQERDPAPEKQITLDPQAADEQKPDPRPEPVAAAAPSLPPQSAPPVTPPALPKSPTAGGWAVQIGSFAKSENAKRLVGELTAKGYDAFIATSGAGASTRHKVRVGPQATRADADRIAARLKKEGRQAAVVSNK